VIIWILKKKKYYKIATYSFVAMFASVIIFILAWLASSNRIFDNNTLEGIITFVALIANFAFPICAIITIIVSLKGIFSSMTTMKYRIILIIYLIFTLIGGYFTIAIISRIYTEANDPCGGTWCTTIDTTIDCNSSSVD
jgi:hypothetical protein